MRRNNMLYSLQPAVYQRAVFENMGLHFREKKCLLDEDRNMRRCLYLADSCNQ